METTLDWRRIEVIDDDVATVLRRMSPAQKTLRISSNHKYHRLRLMGHYKTLHPDWSQDQIQRAVVERLLHGTA